MASDYYFSFKRIFGESKAYSFLKYYFGFETDQELIPLLVSTEFKNRPSDKAAVFDYGNTLVKKDANYNVPRFSHPIKPKDLRVLFDIPCEGKAAAFSPELWIKIIEHGKKVYEHLKDNKSEDKFSVIEKNWYNELKNEHADDDKTCTAWRENQKEAIDQIKSVAKKKAEEETWECDSIIFWSELLEKDSLFSSVLLYDNALCFAIVICLALIGHERNAFTRWITCLIHSREYGCVKDTDGFSTVFSNLGIPSNNNVFMTRRCDTKSPSVWELFQGVKNALVICYTGTAFFTRKSVDNTSETLFHLQRNPLLCLARDAQVTFVVLDPESYAAEDAKKYKIKIEKFNEGCDVNTLFEKNFASARGINTYLQMSDNEVPNITVLATDIALPCAYFLTEYGENNSRNRIRVDLYLPTIDGKSDWITRQSFIVWEWKEKELYSSLKQNALDIVKTSRDYTATKFGCKNLAD